MTSSPAPEEAIREVEIALEAAQSCIRGETPEVGTHEEAQEWTLEQVRTALLTHLPAIAAWNRRAGGEREAWQPIATARRDGSEIILGAPGWSESGFWHDGSENYWKAAGWYAEMDRGNLLTAKPSNPTHWQPLPAAPPRAALAGQTEGERNG